MQKSVQAKHLTHERVITAIVKETAKERGRGGAHLWTLQAEYFADVPHKVLRVKLRALIRAGLVEGCACGCRGDFTVVPGKIEGVAGALPGNTSGNVADV